MGREGLLGNKDSLLVSEGCQVGKGGHSSVWSQRVELSEWVDFVTRQIPIQNRGGFLTRRATQLDTQFLFFFFLLAWKLNGMTILERKVAHDFLISWKGCLASLVIPCGNLGRILIIIITFEPELHEYQIACGG